jgi:hypothetical protein
VINLEIFEVIETLKAALALPPGSQRQALLQSFSAFPALSELISAIDYEALAIADRQALKRKS